MGGSINNTEIRPPKQVAQELEKNAQSKVAEFETTLASMLNELLIKYNQRSTDEIRSRLDNIKNILEGYFESSLDTLYGGSVAKHTYVDGLSDVDSLLIFANKPDLTPTKILKQMETALRKKLGDTIGVHSGNLAVTIKYKDGPEIQIIPCIKTNNGIRIPNFENNTWSSADPSKFANTLTKSNEKCNGKLIPTIKLAKAINATLPEKLQLTGYHIETLAVTAFQGYTETKTTSSMLPHFFKKASELVLKPITDKTGQSTHVDEYLGKANSTERKMVSHTLDRLYRRMFNASAANSKDRWKELFGE